MLMTRVFYIILFGALMASCSSNENNTDTGKGEISLDSAGRAEVKFLSSDSLEITADYYHAENSNKVIVLCHQAGFSRGAYKEIAPRLVEKGFSCLAVDLRSGKFANEVPNLTNIEAVKRGLPTGYQDAEKDIRAAIDYAAKTFNKKVVLWGSSYSATLALMVGRDHPHVVKVVAFSPGIYFASENTIKREVAGYHKPVFVTCSQAEVSMVKQLTMVIPENYLIFHEPEYRGDHGAKVLWQKNQFVDNIYEDLFRFL